MLNERWICCFTHVKNHWFSDSCERQKRFLVFEEKRQMPKGKQKLTHKIEGSFEAKKKAVAVFVNLTAACDTVWHRGLTCKLLRLLLDKHMIRMILELIRNGSFTLTTVDSKRSRLRRLKNGVRQGSILAPFYIFIPMIFPPQRPESMLMLMNRLCCIFLGTGRTWKKF